MSRKVTAGALPLLNLSELDVAQLRELRNDLHEEIMEEYESFLFDTAGQVDAARWKRARSDGQIHAYTEREGVLYRQEHGYDCSPSASKRHRPQAVLAVHSAIPRVLAAGTFHGTLDDVMYGLAFHDTQSFRTNFSNQNDMMEDAAVLATMETASKADPYRFMGIVWFLRTFAVPLSLIDNRDCLTLYDMRLATLRNGERVGVSLAHSIQHRDLPELRDFSTVRATTSLLRVYRQVDPKTVEVMLMHFLDTKGSTPDSFHAQESIKFLLPSSRGLCDGGFRRKLHWLTRQRHQSRPPRSEVATGDGKHCEQCSRPINGLFSSAGCTCTLCNKEVCSKCCVKQEIVLDMAETRPVSRGLEFCLECLVFAKSQSTFTIAQYELQQRGKVSLDVLTKQRISQKSISPISDSVYM